MSFLVSGPMVFPVDGPLSGKGVSVRRGSLSG